MNNNNHRGQWAGCSNFKERRAELLKAHEEFQRLLYSGYQIAEVKKKPRRPRIHKEPTPKRIKVQAGFIIITVEYADWVANGSVGRIIEKY